MRQKALQKLALSSVQAKEAVRKLDSESMAALPGPGEVDFLCGGPPCQGYSGMNRFNKGGPLLWGPHCSVAEIICTPLVL